MTFSHLLLSPGPDRAAAEEAIATVHRTMADLKQIGMTHTNRKPSGEYGEWLAAHLFGLRLHDSKVHKGSDAVDRDGRTYEVKARQANTADSWPSAQIKGGADRHILVVLDESLRFQAAHLLAIPPEEFSGGPIRLRREHRKWIVRSVRREEASGFEEIERSVIAYAEAFSTLARLGVLRTGRDLAADLGEYYVASRFALKLAEGVNQEGWDALDESGHRYQIKTRLPTPDGHRGFKDCFTTATSFDFRPSILTGRHFETLIACFLDARLRPIAYLFVPHEQVVANIRDRASGLRRDPSPRYRWTLRRFLEEASPEKCLFLSPEYQSLLSRLTAVPNVTMTRF